MSMERFKEGIFRHDDGFEYVVADINHEVTDCRNGCELCHVGPSCDYSCPARKGQYMQRTIELCGKRYFLTLTDESRNCDCSGCALYDRCFGQSVAKRNVCSPVRADGSWIGNHVWCI